MDWINLFTALGIVYGPRLLVISGKSREKKQPRPAAPRAETSNNPPPGAPSGISIPGLNIGPNGEIIN